MYKQIQNVHSDKCDSVFVSMSCLLGVGETGHSSVHSPLTITTI